MDNTAIKSIIKISLTDILFKERYVQLCNKYNDFDNCKNVKNSDVEKILNEIKFLMSSSTKESLFFKDYKFKEFSLRFILSYKNGIIDCSDLYWNEDNSIRIYGGFRSYIREINPEIKNRVEYLLPISTNEFDLNQIIRELIKLHTDFVGVMFHMSPARADL